MPPTLPAEAIAVAEVEKLLVVRAETVTLVVARRVMIAPEWTLAAVVTSTAP